MTDHCMVRPYRIPLARIGPFAENNKTSNANRRGEMRQLTHDHTFVQSLIDEGRITEEQSRTHPHRNLILKALDGVRHEEPDLFEFPAEVGDRIAAGELTQAMDRGRDRAPNVPQLLVMKFLQKLLQLPAGGRSDP